jgi:hypothetical protein
MKFIVILLFILGNIGTAYASNCPEGYFPVRSHPRNAYTKTDGTAVSATQVKEQCRPYRTLKNPEPNFTIQAPKNWPNPSEKFKGWTKEVEIKIRSILEKLPKPITNIGKITFLRSSEKSSNPSVSNSENQIIVIYDRRTVTPNLIKHVSIWRKVLKGQLPDRPAFIRKNGSGLTLIQDRAVWASLLSRKSLLQKAAQNSRTKFIWPNLNKTALPDFYR